ncbi:unnamed protein product [Mytilus coruscus]|uniref:B box-type domain-containing protein n=1 Tax=Mytilus coruscus TaxID=42192 RepID=A0A6J8EEW5_MYTCO|nr:unnamed protein product [Mytilus coruscus]
MAFSQSIRQAKVPKPCELCETDINIKWKCVQCNTLMCEKCKKIHLKVQTSIKHDIVDVKSSEAKKEMEHNIVTDNIPYSKVNDFKTKYEQFFAESVQKINQQEKLIIDEVRKYAKALREQLETEKQRIEKYITEKEKNIAEVKENLLNKQSNIQEILDSNQAAKVFSTYPEFNEKEIPNASFKAFPEETRDFFPTKENLKIISNLFGSLQNTKLPKVLPQVNLNVIKSYTTDQNMVLRVLIMDDKKAWISNHLTSTLRKINIDDTIKTVKDISVEVCNMTLTVNNDVLLSLVDSTGVSLLTTKSGEIKPILSVSSLLTLGIHVTKHNEIILGVTERGGTYNLTDKSCRKVIIFEMGGKQKKSYEYDKHKQRLFTVPYRITSNVNNDILVIDRTSDHGGRVVVLDREGQVKWTYQGNPQVNSGDKQFGPTDIVTTSVGHVIVTDFDNHALHVLSGEGDVLTCKVMEDQGIIYPMSLSIDTKGQLWVGCHSENEQTTDAKLHVVKMSF